MGFASTAYFGANTFIPDFTHATGRPGLKDPALAALNVSQLGASFLTLILSDRLVGRRWPFVASAATIATACIGIGAAPGAWIVAWAGVMGFASAFALVLTLALPPLLAPHGDVHRFSAGIFVIVYGFSFAGPLAGGAAWDATGVPAAAFLTLAAGGALMAALAASGPVSRRWPGAPAASAGRGS
jgi:MFS family permease